MGLAAHPVPTPGLSSPATQEIIIKAGGAH